MRSKRGLALAGVTASTLVLLPLAASAQWLVIQEPDRFVAPRRHILERQHGQPSPRHRHHDSEATSGQGEAGDNQDQSRTSTK
jgi:hypothetical protein